MSKHLLLILSLLFCTSNLRAQLNDSVLVDYYGAIRADMVRTVCQFVGLNNDSILKNISNLPTEILEKFNELFSPELKININEDIETL